MRWNEVHLELLFDENSHMLVRLEIMRRQGRHLVKDSAQVVPDLFLDGYLFLEKIDV